jgi:cytochrome c
MKHLLPLAAAAVVLAWSPAHADPHAAMQKAGCFACHAVDKKLVGPAYKDVAAKFKGQPGAAEELAGKVRNGSKGVWGPIPMPANPVAKISDDDLKASIAWILQQ